MKKVYSSLLFICMVSVMVCSCIKDPYDEAAALAARQAQINQNMVSVFGTIFSAEQDWTSTSQGSVTVIADADMDDIVKVQVLALSELGGAQVLNESAAENGSKVLMYFDAPSYLARLYAACVSKDGSYYIKGFKVGQESVSFRSSSAKSVKRKAIAEGLRPKFESLPANPVLSTAEESYARQRGYTGFQNDLLYSMSDADDLARTMSIADLDYDDDFKADLKDIIFSYFPNKKRNIDKIRASKYFNASSYPITTGEDPIILEPIYKNDGGWHEVEYCHLYYYYFKDSDIAYMTEDEQVQFFKDLPKYRAINVNQSVSKNAKSIGMADDVLGKNTAYALIYWGEGTPVIGETVGSYSFPEGYRIGFMLRNCDKNVNHHGELYCDGRLNGQINKYGHLASSKLDTTDPRLAWLSANDHFFLCCESGTDADFNDLILEIEGGVDPMVVIPSAEINTYSFCFEDRDLGDYDMNDVVIKAQRLDLTHVRYSLEATGANDELYLRNLNGTLLNETTEIHEMFALTHNNFINVSSTAARVAPVQETIVVEPNFSFTDPSTQPYIYNKTRDTIIKIAQKGQDPHAIMVPCDFKYPLERVCIKDAYLKFNNWGKNAITDTDWYLYPEDGTDEDGESTKECKVYLRSIFNR